MTSLFDNVYLLTPELTLLVISILALLADLFLKPRYHNIALHIALLGLAVVFVLNISLIGSPKTLLFSGLFINDDAAQLMKAFISLSVLLSFIYSSLYLEERQMPSGDYYVLGLFSTLGMMVLVSSHSLLSMYLGLELLSLPLYAMTAIRRVSPDSAEAAMKYFVMGALASGMLLYGMSLLYGVTGKLDLMDISNAIATNWDSHGMLLSFALVFIMAGIGFKLASVPFHMWAPDVYQGAPTSVTLFISAAPKVAAIGMTLRMLIIALPAMTKEWQQLLLVMSLSSTIIGNLLAVTQTDIKRLLAYSAIAHIGYALFGILAATPAGYAAALYYILIYSLMTVAAFGLIVLLSRHGLEIEKIDDLKGLNKRSPWIAFMMLIVMFSMAGVPPTVGFFTKLFVLKALVAVNMTWVAVVGLLFAVVGAYYYIRIIKVMYFDAPVDSQSIQFPTGVQLVFSVNCLSLLYFGFFPTALLTACFQAFSA